MITRAWLSRLEDADPSLPLALAALLRAADADGRTALDPLLLAYREGYLRVYQPAGGLSESVRDHVVSSVLPRLATEGWIAPPQSELWEQIAAHGDWWAEARQDPESAASGLLALAERAAALAQPPARPRGSVLEGRELGKSYRGRRVVDHVSVHLEQGEIVGLLGPNGAGKTTTFYLLTGLIRPEAGQVTLDGRDLTRAPMFRRARAGIGYLAQEPSIFRRMTVEENILAIL
ncbi:MAG TPA: ATP-binding cassette domain-containing protein, partial [Gemmatimonadales bacterium]|nr:ATP-binding cassette domain-containing protein [Gemmatimonadales bacterium]